MVDYWRFSRNNEERWVSVRASGVTTLLSCDLGQFLYCCDQWGDNIAIFHVNRKTGVLNFTGHYTPFGNPSMIVLVDLAKWN